MPSFDRTPSSFGGCTAATAIIWGCSTGMVAIDLLLAKNAQSGTAIAIAIVAAAAVSTMTIWLSVRTTSPQADKSPHTD